MSSENEIVYLAALLHDIGKFYQRADLHGATKSTILSDAIRRLEPSIAPLHPQSKQYTHKHVLWTAQFFENLKPHFTQYLKLEDGWTYDKLLRLSSTHHAPDANNLLERIIQKADHYSSGIDRDKDGGTGWKDAEEESDKKWDAFKRTRMRSVFEGISLKSPVSSGNDYKMKMPLGPICTTDEFFPIPAGESDDATDYRKLWMDFEAELKFIQNNTIRAFNDSLLYLLEKYTGRIPSSTQHLPDVSLFDHLKTTAAFALSLKAYIDDKEMTDLPGPSEKPFALVGGTLSGIQKFIYGIVAKGAAKNLKGRSFYLQLLVDNVLQILLDELGLQSGNIVYSSGGGFYLIAPNTGRLQVELLGLENKLAKQLFKYHGVEIYLSLDFVTFGEEELFNQAGDGKNIGSVWKELTEKLSSKKSKRFDKLMKKDFELFFTPQKVSTEKKRDSITGEELTTSIRFLDEPLKEQPVNEYTWKQIELGRQLKKTAYWIISKQKLTYFPNKILEFEPVGLGMYNYFISDSDKKDFDPDLKKSADNVRVVHLNKDNFLESIHKGTNNIYGFAWYGGNDYAINQFDEPKTFEELAGVRLDAPNHQEDSKRSSGPNLTRLGVLRMDVDNLGAIFRKGFAPNRLSFSRYSTLSRSMDWFFKGYLNTIWRTSDKYKGYTQIIYSGGDDLFIVGKWDYLIEMAADIRLAFKKWVCGNPEITLSGGMAIVGPRFPVLKSAAYSEIFEKAAKSHKLVAQEKDAFAFVAYKPNGSTGEMLVPLNWEHEFSYLQKLKNELSGFMGMDKDGLPEGISSTLLNLLEQSNMQLNSDGRFYPTNYRVIWLVAYHFKRSGSKKNDLVREFFQAWIKNIMTGKIRQEPSLEQTKYHALQFLAIAARWAALEKRSLL